MKQCIVLLCVIIPGITYLIAESNGMIQEPSPNFLERYDIDLGERVTPSILVLHYTAIPFSRVKEIFAKSEVPTPVSAHYTVDENGQVYQHVDEDKAARHAGVSYWRGIGGTDASQKKLNLYSIGVEQVNLGFKVDETQPVGVLVNGSEKEWYPFDLREIKASIALCQQILARNKQIPARNVVAHSDIAPGRKNDPGPLYPWKLLAEHGIGVWPDMEKIRALSCLTPRIYMSAKRRERWLINHLQIWGYCKPDGEVTSEDVIRSFQMHYRPQLIDGKADKGTIKCLQALLCEHVLKKNEKCCCFPG